MRGKMLKITEDKKTIFLSKDDCRKQIRIAPIDFFETPSEIKNRLIGYKEVIEQAISQL